MKRYTYKPGDEHYKMLDFYLKEFQYITAWGSNEELAARGRKFGTVQIAMMPWLKDKLCIIGHDDGDQIHMDVYDQSESKAWAKAYEEQAKETNEVPFAVFMGKSKAIFAPNLEEKRRKGAP